MSKHVQGCALKQPPSNLPNTSWGLVCLLGNSVCFVGQQKYLQTQGVWKPIQTQHHVLGSETRGGGSSLALWKSRLHGAPLTLHQLFQENHTPTWRIIPGRQGYVVHGPWTPSKLPFLWLINGGNPNYLLTGMILQASPPLDMDFTPAKNIFQGHFSITGRFWQMPASRSHQKWRAIQNQNKCNTRNIQGGEHKQTIHHNSL